MPQDPPVLPGAVRELRRGVSVVRGVHRVVQQPAPSPRLGLRDAGTAPFGRARSDPGGASPAESRVHGPATGVPCGSCVKVPEVEGNPSRGWWGKPGPFPCHNSFSKQTLMNSWPKACRKRAAEAALPPLHPGQRGSRRHAAPQWMRHRLTNTPMYLQAVSFRPIFSAQNPDSLTLHKSKDKNTKAFGEPEA